MIKKLFVQLASYWRRAPQNDVKERAETAKLEEKVREEVREEHQEMVAEEKPREIPANESIGSA